MKGNYTIPYCIVQYHTYDTLVISTDLYIVRARQSQHSYQISFHSIHNPTANSNACLALPHVSQKFLINEMTGTNGTSGANGATIGTTKVKQGLAQMLKGGVIVSRRLVRWREPDLIRNAKSSLLFFVYRVCDS